MQTGIDMLFKQGSLAGIFLGIMLCAIIMFAAFTRKLITEQLAMKDKRIEALERDVKELQEFNRTELSQLIQNSNKIMQRSVDMAERLEEALIHFKRENR